MSAGNTQTAQQDEINKLTSKPAKKQSYSNTLFPPLLYHIRGGNASPILWGERVFMEEYTRPLPRMRTIKETATELNLPVYFIRQLVRQRKTSCVLAGKKALINLDKLIDYLNNGGEQA